MSRFCTKNHIEAYTPGEQPKQGEYIKLNTNESPFPPPVEIEEAIVLGSKTLQLYSDNTCAGLTKTFAEYRGVGEENVLFANGSDEILAFSFLGFCSDTVGICFPEISYGFYEVFAQLFGVEGEKIPLQEDLSVGAEDYYGKGKTVLIANPNAPTGIALSLSEVEAIVAKNPENVVIIDEAYVDFGGESAGSLTKRYDNLLVVGTFSKSRNLAGARLGYAIGHEALIADLNRVKYSFNPYNVNSLSQIVGKISLEQEAYFQECRKTIMETRGFFVEGLEKLGFRTLPSRANFVFTTTDALSGAELLSGLKERKILVRHFTNPKISQYVRITIGTREEMEVVLQNLQEIIEGK